MIEIRAKREDSPRGAHYETEHDTWRALLYVLHAAGAPVPAEHAEAFSGVDSAEESAEIAERLERFLDTHVDNVFVRQTDEERLPGSGRFIGAPDPEETPGVPPKVSREEVRSFAAFVRDSGGFRVQ